MDGTSPSPIPSVGIPGGMHSHTHGDLPSTVHSMPLSGDILPAWVTWLWLISLAAILVLHCAHLVRMDGQHRWYHASHVLMLVGMLYMYAAMEFRWTWFPYQLWVGIFVASSAAILSWLVVRLVRRRPFSALWLLALVMQASMIYMWLPDWWAPLTWTLVVYFTLEAVAWLMGELDDCEGKLVIGPGDRSTSTPIGHPGPVLNVSMAIMASSMAYMFVAMQLMR